MTNKPDTLPEGRLGASVGRISRRSLRAMKARWEKDLARLAADQPPDGRWEWATPNIETQRNLATAIAWIDGMITGEEVRDDNYAARDIDAQPQSLLNQEKPK